MDSALVPPPDTPIPSAKAAATAGPASTGYGAMAKMHRTAQAFEQSFLSTMLGSMFEGVGSKDPAFGGGEGEQAFRSFFNDALAKGVVKHGGVGVSQAVERQLLKMQGAH